jgi:hypothetical protein
VELQDPFLRSGFTIRSIDHLRFPRLPAAAAYLFHRNGAVWSEDPDLPLHHPVLPLLIVVVFFALVPVVWFVVSDFLRS